MNGLLLILLLACRSGGGADAGDPAAVSDVQTALAQVDAGIARTRGRLGAGDRAGAATELRKTYTDAFGPLEPVLRAHDPQETFELEYEFGRLAANAEGRADVAELDRQARALGERITRSVAAAQAAAQPPATP